MRQQAHRLAGGLAGVQRGVHTVGQAARFFLDGAAPVEGKFDHLVGLCQVLGQVVVDHADGAVGLHIRLPGGVGQLVQAADEPQPQPDAFALKRQVAAQDARQQQHGGLVRVGGAAVTAARTLAVGAKARPAQRADGAVTQGRGGLHQAVHHRIHRERVAEVVKVRGLAAAVQHEAGAAAARRAAVHGPRLHDDVVVGPVVGVGQQCFQPAAQGVAFQVTGHDTQVTADGLRRVG
jgi:hypothetical protein